VSVEEMHEHLQPWYDTWLAEHAGTDLIYAVGSDKKPQLQQVHFVRDMLAAIVWQDVPYEKRAPASPRECKETAFVVGEHLSKSVRLPVYSLERPDLGLRIVARDNFYDWNVSVASERDVATDLRGFPLDYWIESERERFKDGYQPGRSWGYCFFQGFPSDMQFGPYKENKRRFSMCVGSDYELFTLVWLIMRDVRGGRDGSV
jgi:hypothetical protein